ncbi:MAG: ATP-binding protein [Spirosomaceae bacterium]|jgi:predicted HTH transcriptional regulator|nr:ATP-binding protein [Spirosomataceae bacterium]
MDYRTLKELVRQGEGKHLEFKLKTNHPEKIVREMVAFANTDGGRLLIGIGDDRSIKGLKHVDEDEYLMVRAVEKYCTEGLEYRMERVNVGDERDVLVFTIPPSRSRPHFVKEEIDITKGSPLLVKKKFVPHKNEKKIVHRAYIRVADKSIQASWEMRQIMRRKSENRNVRFNYGDKEHKLMQHLDQHKSVTVDGFATVAGIPRNLASKTLVLLVLANVLEVHPDEMVDRYTMIAP